MRRKAAFEPPSRPHLFALATASLMMTGCNLHPVKPVELQKNSDFRVDVDLEVNKDVDILFVMDNSGSMGDEQGKLAANFSSFIDVLEKKDVDANYRIGVTTTDNGNAECSGTTSEGGQLRLLSCTQRPDEFVWPKINPQVMAYDTACANYCPAEIGDNLSVIPTATANDGELRARPWIERTEGVSNIMGGTTTQAFQCFGPQGVDGCGFEAQLESMYKAVQRANDTGEYQYDFIRDNAILAVIHVTDEADCSANEAWQADVFGRKLAEADKVFWEDPTSTVPTSAICWNAGVKCTGSGGLYDDCASQDYDEAGNEISADAAPSDAVLRPVSRYTGLLQQIEEQKKNYDSDQEVIVALLGGVPLGYETGMVDLRYQESPDPDTSANFGIDWGCQSSGTAGEVQTAVPPVRLREFAEAFNEDASSENIFSICADDYSGALTAVADAIRDQVKPGCFTKCVKDIDETTPELLDPDCTVTQTVEATGEKVEVPPCEAGVLPTGEAVCYVTRTGDDVDPQCAQDGWNLEFVLVRDPAQPAPGGSKVSATCQLSDFPELECPGTGS